MNPLIGKTITAVTVANDAESIRFDVTEGESITATVDAQCCSTTWIESLDNVEALIDGTVRAVENLGADEARTTETVKYDIVGYPYDVVTQYYGCRITTERGHCTIDYRNSSNGYYGGSLVWPGEDAEDKEENDEDTDE